MLQMTKEDLMMEARNEGYRPELLEKVLILLNLLHEFMMAPILKNKIVLKGGTALNLFCFVLNMFRAYLLIWILIILVQKTERLCCRIK